MRKVMLLSFLLVLAGCDRLPFLQGGGNEGNGSAAANASGNATAAAPANAGITSSRSLAGLAGSQGGQSGQGGKDPAAIPAGARGTVDPRLVGAWSDEGDCKSVTTLRADGTFVASNGNTGRWESRGDELVFLTNGQEVRLRIDSIEPDRVVTTNAEGNTGPSTRC